MMWLLLGGLEVAGPGGLGKRAGVSEFKEPAALS